MKNNILDANYRVIVIAKDIIINFNATKEEMQNRLNFLFTHITTPEKFRFDENGYDTAPEFNEQVIVSVIDENLDTSIFPLSEYRKYIARFIDKKEEI